MKAIGLNEYRELRQAGKDQPETERPSNREVNIFVPTSPNSYSRNLEFNLERAETYEEYMAILNNIAVEEIKAAAKEVQKKLRGRLGQDQDGFIAVHNKILGRDMKELALIEAPQVAELRQSFSLAESSGRNLRINNLYLGDSIFY